MSSDLQAAVAAANAMTRWIEALPPGQTALSGTAWPLLATLVDAASGPARDELAAAVGIDGAAAPAAARALAAALDGRPEVALALSAWIRRGIELLPEWRAANDLVAVAPLDGQEPIDAWVREHTAGRIDRCPITVDAGTLVLLLCACAVDTRWEADTQSSSLRPAEGPWAERWVVALRQRTGDLDGVEVVDGEHGNVTVATLRTSAGIDVRLAIGAPEQPTNVVLRDAVAHLLGERSGRSGSALGDDVDAPGLRSVVLHTHVEDAPPELVLTAAAFDIEATHDLLELPAVFGLDTCTDDSVGHFPGLSSQPLAVGQAKQAVRCTMDHEGFRAASVTAIGMLAGAAPPTHEVRSLVATFDRPYAFLAYDRATRLVLFAGTVQEPLTDP